MQEKTKQGQTRGRRQTRSWLALLITGVLLAGTLPARQAAADGAASRAGYDVSGPRTANGVTTWDCVWFGNYWQDDTNGDGKADKKDAKQPIRWRVLSVSGDDAFLLADQNLDAQPYNTEYREVTWETCTMRSWLNGYGAGANQEGRDYSGSGASFLNNAFTAEEQAALRTTAVVNAGNDYHSPPTPGGNDTSDRVYLLSLGEAMNPAYGFTSDQSNTKTREPRNTNYAEAMGSYTYTYSDSGGEYTGNGIWWLRSPGNFRNCASDVIKYGYVYEGGNHVNSSEIGTRPALHVNLSATSSYSYAGTVSSDGSQDVPTAKPTTKPTATPTEAPTAVPTAKPTMEPTAVPTAKPTEVPTAVPTAKPTAEPTATPTQKPAMVQGNAKPKAVTGLRLKQKSRIVTVSWKKVPGAKGYEAWYGTSKKWKEKKKKTVRKNTFSVKGLRRGKTYYFRIRAYRTDKGKKTVGSWSSTKKITIRK